MSSEQKSIVNLEEPQQLSKALENRGIEATMWKAIMASVFPGAKAASALMAWDYCAARKLDIMKKPCHIVGMSVDNPQTGQREWRDVIMPGIAEQRITASRTGVYAGQDKPELGELVEHAIGGEKIMAPEFATVTVYRMLGDEKIAFSHTEWFEEACATKRNGELNAMWKKRKRSQLIKCAEAGALRKAFPEELGGIHSAEEMEGKVINMGSADVVSDDEEKNKSGGANAVSDMLNKQKQPAEAEEEAPAEDNSVIVDAEFVEDMDNADAMLNAADEGEQDFTPLNKQKIKVIQAQLSNNEMTEDELFEKLNVKGFDEIDATSINFVLEVVNREKLAE